MSQNHTTSIKIPQVPRDTRIAIKGVYAVLGSMRGLKKLAG
jgi:hypothetical protein